MSVQDTRKRLKPKNFLELSSESPALLLSKWNLCFHLTGYTDTVEETVDNKTLTTLVGKTGLEGLYNEQLTGTLEA